MSGFQSCGGRLGWLWKQTLMSYSLASFSKRVEGIERLGGHAVKAEFFREFEGLAGLGFVLGNVGDAEVHGGHVVVLLEMVDDGLDLVIGEIRAEFQVAVVAAEFLARINLDAAHSGGGGHFDGFEEREFLERPALHGDRESGGSERGWGIGAAFERRASRAEAAGIMVRSERRFMVGLMEYDRVTGEIHPTYHFSGMPSRERFSILNGTSKVCTLS